jgi:hypothetical protein
MPLQVVSGASLLDGAPEHSLLLRAAHSDMAKPMLPLPPVSPDSVCMCSQAVRQVLELEHESVVTRRPGSHLCVPC